MKKPKPGPEVTAKWKELEPGALVMCVDVGELELPGGRQWGVTKSLNEMHLFVRTDMMDGPPIVEGAKVSQRVPLRRQFVLDLKPLIDGLATELLRREAALSTGQADAKG